MLPSASVILREMAVPCSRLTFQVYELPVRLLAMLASAGADTCPAGIAALHVRVRIPFDRLFTYRM